MRMIFVLFFVVIYLGLMTGCEGESHPPAPAPPPPSVTHVEVDTEPVGVGLGVIGGGIVIAAWVISVMAGGERED